MYNHDIHTWGMPSMNLQNSCKEVIRHMHYFFVYILPDLSWRVPRKRKLLILQSCRMQTLCSRIEVLFFQSSHLWCQFSIIQFDSKPLEIEHGCKFWTLCLCRFTSGLALKKINFDNIRLLQPLNSFILLHKGALKHKSQWWAVERYW